MGTVVRYNTAILMSIMSPILILAVGQRYVVIYIRILTMHVSLLMKCIKCPCANMAVITVRN